MKKAKTNKEKAKKIFLTKGIDKPTKDFMTEIMQDVQKGLEDFKFLQESDLYVSDNCAVWGNIFDIMKCDIINPVIGCKGCKHDPKTFEK